MAFEEIKCKGGMGIRNCMDIFHDIMTHIYFFTITDTLKFYKFLFTGDLFEYFLKEQLKPLYFSRKLLSSH